MAANLPIWKGTPPGSLVETPGSGALKLAERVTLTKNYEGRLADCYTYAFLVPRGTYSMFSLNGILRPFVVEEASVATDRGSKGAVTVTWLLQSVVPPDEHSVVPFEVNPPTERAPYFTTLTKDDLSKARAVFTAANAQGKTAVESAIEGTTNKVLTKALVNKWLKGQETFYQAGIKYQWTLFSYSAPLATIGGYRQAPGGPFAAFLPGSMSWLRQCDEVVFSNGLYKLTRTWLGALAGWWDTDIYPAG